MTAHFIDQRPWKCNGFEPFLLNAILFLCRQFNPAVTYHCDANDAILDIKESVRNMHQQIGKVNLTPSSADARLRDFERENAAFQGLLPRLLQDRPGTFVAIRNGGIIDEDMDEMELARRLETKHRNAFVLVRQVTPKNGGEDHLESPEGES
jgi:hypothetical protein